VEEVLANNGHGWNNTLRQGRWLGLLAQEFTSLRGALDERSCSRAAGSVVVSTTSRGATACCVAVPR
jgi:hypothetical protein